MGGKAIGHCMSHTLTFNAESKDRAISDYCTYLWCCVCSASKHDGLDFDLSLMDFADSISPEDIQAWTATLNEGGAEAEDDGEKKSQPQ